MLRKIAFIVLLVAIGVFVLVLAQFDTVRIPGRVQLPEDGFSHHLLGRVLSRWVNDEGRVDYVGLRDDRDNLDQYLSALALTSPKDDPDRFDGRDAELAYWINAYNAAVLYGVTERPELRSVNDERWSFFVFTRYQLGDEAYSLFELEDEIIRGDYDEPRVHFALNCASLGCPALPKTPFLPETLDEQLDAESRAFCADPDNVRVEGDVVKVSQIFQWYAEDFEPAGGPVAFCRAHGREDLPDGAEVQYIPYDWALNAQARAGAAARSP